MRDIAWIDSPIPVLCRALQGSTHVASTELRADDFSNQLLLHFFELGFLVSSRIVLVQNSNGRLQLIHRWPATHEHSQMHPANFQAARPEASLPVLPDQSPDQPKGQWLALIAYQGILLAVFNNSRARASARLRSTGFFTFSVSFERSR